MDPDQTAPIGAVCSGSTLFASILNLSLMLGNYLQQMTFSDAFFLGDLRVNYCLRVSSADNLCKQFGPRSGTTFCPAKLFDTLIVFKDFSKT